MARIRSIHACRSTILIIIGVLSIKWWPHSRAAHTTLAGLCAFPNQPGVVGWKGGLVFLKSQLVDSATGRLDLCASANPPVTCVPVFQHGKKDSYHYALFAHAVGLPNWSLQAGTLTSVMQSGNMVTFNTSVPVGMLGNAGYKLDAQGKLIFDAQGNLTPTTDPKCANG